MILATDQATRGTRRPKRTFGASRRAEETYARQLRSIARHVGQIIRAFPAADPASLPEMQRALMAYSQALEPWAKSAAARMVDDVSKRDELAWKDLFDDHYERYQAHSKAMATAMRAEIRDAPTGQALRDSLQESVSLITSLPTEAGQRVHELTTEAMINGSRASEIVDEIMQSGDVTVSRATLIARTETARTSSLLTQVRAQHIGCTSYVWRTAGDGRVRESHRKMNGKVVQFGDPPLLSDGTQTHAGAIYNCRCYCEPIIPD